jgi:hypothetical protein
MSGAADRRHFAAATEGADMEPVETRERSVGEKVQEASDVVSSKAGEAADRGRGMVADQVGTRSAQASDQIGWAAQTMRRAADQARAEGDIGHARIADQVADRGERVSSYLQDIEPEQLLNDVEDFARRQPWVVAGAGLFIGFALARSLKASSGRRYQTRSVGSRYRGNGAAEWTASPGAPRDVIASTPPRTGGIGNEYA